MVVVGGGGDGDGDDDGGDDGGDDDGDRRWKLLLLLLLPFVLVGRKGLVESRSDGLLVSIRRD